MTPEIVRTQSPKNVGKFAQPDTKHKNLETPENRTLPNFKSPKMGEACLQPTYPTFDMCPWVLWPSHVYISTLIGLILSLISGVPCVKIKVINQFSVYLLHIPSLHYLAEVALHVQGSLKEQFWSLLGSLKASGSLEVLGSHKVPYRPFFPCESCFGPL